MRSRVAAALAALMLLSAGCAVGGLDYQGLETHLRSKDCPSAEGYIEKAKESYGKNRALIYLMDSGTVKLLCGDYEGSHRLPHEADSLAQDPTPSWSSTVRCPSRWHKPWPSESKANSRPTGASASPVSRVPRGGVPRNRSGSFTGP